MTVKHHVVVFSDDEADLVRLLLMIRVKKMDPIELPEDHELARAALARFSTATVILTP